MIEPYIETASGKKFHFLNPSPDEIDIIDIAYALSNQCRYNGHCNRFYSVAEHSALVASLVPEKFKLDALLHDAAEAYLSDIPSPVKQFFPEYKKLEQTVMEVIADKFKVPNWNSDIVKKADLQQLCTEAYNLLPSKGEGWSIIEGLDFKDGRKPMCFPPVHAYGVFMNVFANLTAPKIIVENA